MLSTLGVLGVSIIGNLQDFFGTSFIGRPLITGLLLGLLFEDVNLGLRLGVMIEFVFLSLMGVGVTTPLDEVMGGIISISLALTFGLSDGMVLVVAVAAAYCGMKIKDLLNQYIFPSFVKKAEVALQAGRLSSHVSLHLWISIVKVVSLSVITIDLFIVLSILLPLMPIQLPGLLSKSLDNVMYLLPILGIAAFVYSVKSTSAQLLMVISFFVTLYLKIDTLILLGVAVVVMGILLRRSLFKVESNGEVIEDDF